MGRFCTARREGELVSSCDLRVVRKRRASSPNIVRNDRGAGGRHPFAFVTGGQAWRRVPVLVAPALIRCDGLWLTPVAAQQRNWLAQGQHHHDGEGCRSEHVLRQQIRWQGPRQR